MELVQLIHADCLEHMRSMPAQSVDLVFGSPPYEDARTYGIDFKRAGEDWVAWMVEVFQASLHVSKGLVAFVVEGRTRSYRYSATPALLMADLHRAGVHLRKPPVFHRVGIPGSGGPDWLRNDWEWIVCASRPGKLPWSENTACGHIPKWTPGGEMSHRVGNGSRVNQWGHSINSGATVVERNGQVRSRGQRPSHTAADRLHTKRTQNGEMEVQGYSAPVLANPGNVIYCNVGGGTMGATEAHDNEAPFPLKLAEFFVRSFCPPEGVVLDPFSGSGTTAAAAIAHGRRAIGIDIRADQIALARKRLLGTPRPLWTADEPLAKNSEKKSV